MFRLCTPYEVRLLLLVTILTAQTEFQNGGWGHVTKIRICRVYTNKLTVLLVHECSANDETVGIKLKCTFSGGSMFRIATPLNSKMRGPVAAPCLASSRVWWSRHSAGTTAFAVAPNPIPPPSCYTVTYSCTRKTPKKFSR